MTKEFLTSVPVCCRPAECPGMIAHKLTNMLEEIHQENLGFLPAREQWQVGFEVPGILLDPLWKGQ